MRTLRRAAARLALYLALCLLSAAPLFGQALPRATPEDVGLSSERLERLSAVFQGYVDDGRLPGAVVLVARHGRIAYLEAFGERDVEADETLPEDALFRIASQSKAMVSVGILILQEEGKLLLSDPVSKHLPAFSQTTVAVPREDGGYDVVPADRPITLRDLLTHRAGLGYGYGPAADRWAEAGIQGWYFAHRDEPIGETVSRMAALPFDAQPGTRWVYGYSTDVLGAVIERVSGRPLDAFLRERLFEPLGLRDTHFYLPPEKAGRLAVVYSAREDGGLERAPDPGDGVGQGHYVEGPRKSFSGGAGLVSTAGDYARFLQMLLGGGALDGRRILSPTSVELMTVDHLVDIDQAPGRGFGLGFWVIEDLGAFGAPGSVGSYGWGGAYHSTYWVDPREDLVVVYFTQLIPAGRIDDHAKLRTLVYQAVVDGGAR